MPPSARVSRDEIADAALVMLDAVGADGLSMRKLAAELGLGTMSIYHHFADKDALLGAAVDRAVAPLTIPVKGVAAGRAFVLATALRVYDVMRAHPGIHSIRTGGPMLRLSTLVVSEHLLSGLLDAGLDPAAASAANILILEYVSGSSATPVMVDSAETLRNLNAMLPVETFPALHRTNDAALDEFGAAFTRRDMLVRNLELLLDAVGARA